MGSVSHSRTHLDSRPWAINQVSAICDFADQVSVKLISIADFIYASTTDYYIGNLIVEGNRQEALIFVNYNMSCFAYTTTDFTNYNPCPSLTVDSCKNFLVKVVGTSPNSTLRLKVTVISYEHTHNHFALV